MFTNKINYVVDENNLSKQKYLEKINTYKFILCPWGNGIDTHRLWETLYSNSITVIKYHRALSKFSDLPIIYLIGSKRGEYFINTFFSIIFLSFASANL